MTLRATGVAVGWLGLVMGLKRARVLRAPDARKGCHIGTGVLFCMCWRMFPAGPAARFWAAAIPGAITVQVVAVGLGLWRGEGGGPPSAPGRSPRLRPPPLPPPPRAPPPPDSLHFPLFR